MPKSRVTRFVNLANPFKRDSPVYQVPKNTVIGKPILWGEKGRLPFEIIAAVKDSPTARRCAAKLDAFIQGDGFAKPDAAEFLVNPEQTADDLLNQIASDAGTFEGFALRVKFDAGLKPAEVYYVPLQTIIKLDNGQFLINATIGTRNYDKSKDEIVYPYNLEKPELIREMMSEVTADKPQKGQLAFVYRKTGLTPDYPEPIWWAGREDILADAEIPKMDLAAIENNFQPPLVMFIPGLDNQKQDEHGKTEEDYAAEDVESLTSKENRSKALLLTGANAEMAPKLMTYDNGKAFLNIDAKRDTIARAVCRNFGIHPVLIGLTTAGQLGQTQEILNAIELAQSEVNARQRQITRTFAAIFKEANKDWSISNISPLKVIPPEVLAQLTPDEIRALGGYGKKPKTTESVKETEQDADNEE